MKITRETRKRGCFFLHRTQLHFKIAHPRYACLYFVVLEQARSCETSQAHHAIVLCVVFALIEEQCTYSLHITIVLLSPYSINIRFIRDTFASFLLILCTITRLFSQPKTHAARLLFCASSLSICFTGVGKSMPS